MEYAPSQESSVRFQHSNIRSNTDHSRNVLASHWSLVFHNKISIRCKSIEITRCKKREICKLLFSQCWKCARGHAVFGSLPMLASKHLPTLLPLRCSVISCTPQKIPRLLSLHVENVHGNIIRLPSVCLVYLLKDDGYLPTTWKKNKTPKTPPSASTSRPSVAKSHSGWDTWR